MSKEHDSAPESAWLPPLAIVAALASLVLPYGTCGGGDTIGLFIALDFWPAVVLMLAGFLISVAAAVLAKSARGILYGLTTLASASALLVLASWAVNFVNAAKSPRPRLLFGFWIGIVSLISAAMSSAYLAWQETVSPETGTEPPPAGPGPGD